MLKLMPLLIAKAEEEQLIKFRFDILYDTTLSLVISHIYIEIVDEM